MKLLLLLPAVLFHVVHHATSDDDKPVSYRLLEHQKPQKYTLDLKFDKNVFDATSTGFDGNLTIIFLVSRTVNYIQFHAPVAIKEMEFIVNQTYLVPIESEAYDPVTNIYTITSKENLNYTHNYTLNVQYSGELDTSDMRGIYRSYYLDEDENPQYFVATYFQPTYARLAFPCFDEPKMKASFVISITYPKGFTALSNTVMDSDTVEVDEDYEKVTFKETPIMSTHLVGFVISKFTCSQGNNLTNSIPYNVCSRNKLIEERSLALQLGPQFMKKLENITALNYTDHLLGKLDQVAIPGNIARNVENWGLISYREQSLLWNDKESSLAYRNVVMDLFLKLAHCWFGNLETVEWWDYTFLNLGFSRFYQYHAAAQIDTFNQWELDNQFVIDQLQPSLVLDALSSTTPLSYPVETPSEILAKFNTLSYSKGASIIRMAQHVIGPKNFQRGIEYFLPIYNGSTIMPIYVWNKLEVFLPRELLPSTKNLNGVMENWTEMAGFPLVTVTIKGNNIILTQERFLYSREEDFTEWCVPITYTLSQDLDKFENTTTKVWLLPGTSQTLYDIIEEDDWIILNNQQVGYYRVNYDDRLWQKIKEVLFTNHTVIHVLNRAQIVDDLLNLARARVVNYSYAFEIITYFKEETEYYPWNSAIASFKYLLTQVGEYSVVGIEISSMIQELLQKVYQSLSFDNVDPNNQVYILKLLEITSIACKLGEESCITTVKDLFAKFKLGNSVDKNLRKVVYCNGLRYSDDIVSDWNFLWKTFQSETLESERENMIAALGCIRDDTTLKYYLDQSMNSSSGINLHDLPNVWSSVYSETLEGVDAAFDYLYENYTSFSDYYPSATSILISVVESFTTEDQLEKLDALITSGRLTSSVRAVAQSALQSAKEKIEWAQSIKDDLLVYFEVPETTTEDSSTTPGSASQVSVSFKILVIILVFSKLVTFLV